MLQSPYFFVFRLLNKNRLQIIPHQAFKNLNSLELMYVSNRRLCFKNVPTMESILGLTMGVCSQIGGLVSTETVVLRQEVKHKTLDLSTELIR